MRHLRFAPLLCALLACCALAQQNSSQTERAQSGSAQSVAARPASVPEQMGAAAENDADPMLDLPPLPKDKVSLVGGNVTGIDRVRNRITVEAFGGKKMKLAFDERTHVYRDGVETTQLGIRKGDRVYVDTQLVGSTVFARNIRVNSKTGSADAQGQIESYDPQRGMVVISDSLSSESVTFRVTPNTAIRGKAGTAAELQRGALVKVKFAPEAPGRGVAQEITVTVRPGETFTFAGRVSYLDVRSGMFVVQNQTDSKAYEIRFNPAEAMARDLALGLDVMVSAVFDGNGYMARNITVSEARK